MTTLNDGIDFLKKKSTPSSSQIFEKAGGTSHLGWFDRPFVDLNLHQGPHRPFLYPQGLREKRWHFFSLSSSRAVVGMAVVSTGYASNLFLYAFDLTTKKFHQFEHLSPLSSKARLASHSLSGESCYEAKNHRILIQNHADQGYYSLSFHCQDRNNHFIRGEIKIKVEGEPLVNSREVSPGKIVYTHQNSLLRPEGTLEWDGERYHFDSQKDFSTMDFTKGIHAYRTTWNWASAGGHSEEGIPVAINFAADMIEGGTNDVAVFWIGTRIYRVPKVHFSYGNPQEKWTLQSRSSPGQGEIQLEFIPRGLREGNVNLGLIASRFKQPFGHFSGFLKTPEEGTYSVRNMVGVTEEHFAKW